VCGNRKQDKIMSNNIDKRSLAIYALVEKRFPFVPISPQRVRSAAKGVISPGLFENVGQGALVPVQMGP
jgi:hypothetical protein